ncbi:hypothetical protein FZ983_20595 [Azospirillum sp. B21]|uniref:O-linked N-acetylglucosamine transferase family protein n=1 Tax=Azospirillum sp. B21 TaxID=2607496 RepID=UPI0011ED926E|nr:hypothetical protein [Azospirillum sp. B21]KAA0577974.1 hypothetical protein FZ983_20595 [Azospirillum sp. B21]
MSHGPAILSRDTSDLRVDLGCGDHKPDGFVGVDVAPGPGVDLVCDLTGRFPFETGSVAHLRAHDLIEHLPDRLHTMNEIWRVCRGGAIVDIRVPSTDGRGAFQDPTHISYWNANSFFYYSVDHPAYLSLCRKYGFRGAFRIRSLSSSATPDQVVHVQVMLEVIKPAAEPQQAHPESLPSPLPSPLEAVARFDGGAAVSERLGLAMELARMTPDRFRAFCASDSLDRYTRLLAARAPARLGEAEQSFCDLLEETYRDGITRPEQFVCQLAALLLKPAYRLPARFNLDLLPAALADAFVAATCRSPAFFSQPGEAERYADFQTAWLGYLDHGLEAGQGRQPWPEAAFAFCRSGEMLGSYFSGRNLCPLARHRARIIEWSLRRLGYRLDHSPPPRRAATIRVGILLLTFLPTPELFCVLPLLQRPAADMEVTVYVVEPDSGTFERDAVAKVARIVDLPKNLAQMVDIIRRDDLDVLHFASNLTGAPSVSAMLAAHRLARVQTTSIASVLSTGFSAMDLYVSASGLERDRFPQQHYTEELVKLPGTVHCFVHGKGAMPGDSRTGQPGLPVSPGEVVLTSGASLYKLTPETVEAWLDILARVPFARLVLFPFAPSWSATYPKQEFSEYLLDKLVRRGIAASRVRIIDTPGFNRVGIRNSMRNFHICLDSFPFSGSTSLIEPLELGMPVVTLADTTLRSAMGASLLHALDLGELVADDAAGYVDIACRLAGDPDHRARISSRISAAMARPPSFLDWESHAGQMYELFRSRVRCL